MRSPKSGSRTSSLHDGSSSEYDDILEAQTPYDDVETPLLATDLPPELVPDRKFQRNIMLISFIVIGLVETYSFLTNAPLQEIIEDFICHNQYPDHMMNEPTIQDRRCKEPDVQKTLAMVKSWWSSTEMWVRKCCLRAPFNADCVVNELDSCSCANTVRHHRRQVRSSSRHLPVALRPPA
jgi:hypothetical protein